MPVRIYIDPAKTGIRVKGAWDKGLAILSEEILADCNEFCKEDQHTLINSSLLHSRPQQGILIWETPYAKRQYWEIKTSLTPGRTWKWCETAKQHYGERWRRLAERLLGENL